MKSRGFVCGFSISGVLVWACRRLGFVQKLDFVLRRRAFRGAWHLASIPHATSRAKFFKHSNLFCAFWFFAHSGFIPEAHWPFTPLSLYTVRPVILNLLSLILKSTVELGDLKGEAIKGQINI